MKTHQQPVVKDWEQHTGYRGKVFWRFQGKLSVCIWENSVMRNRRFVVLDMSRPISTHEDLEEAKAAVLELLIKHAEASR
jgi:hypothetical protein